MNHKIGALWMNREVYQEYCVIVKWPLVEAKYIRLVIFYDIECLVNE